MGEKCSFIIREEQLERLDSDVEDGKFSNRSDAIREYLDQGIEEEDRVEELEERVEHLEDLLSRARDSYYRELEINEKLRERVDDE
jgi:Arc/MetJ-type ribon-helix-helix transcriptional regulator